MFSSSTFVAHVLRAQVRVDSTAATVDDVHRLMRTAQTNRRGKTSVKGVRIMGKHILLTWVRECSYNNAYAWVKNALENRVSNDWKLKGRYSLWAADVLVNAARSGAASSGDPPPGGSPAAASQTAHTKEQVCCASAGTQGDGERLTPLQEVGCWSS